MCNILSEIYLGEFGFFFGKFGGDGEDPSCIKLFFLVFCQFLSSRGSVVLHQGVVSVLASSWVALGRTIKHTDWAVKRDFRTLQTILFNPPFASRLSEPPFLWVDCGVCGAGSWEGENGIDKREMPIGQFQSGYVLREPGGGNGWARLSLPQSIVGLYEIERVVGGAVKALFAFIDIFIIYRYGRYHAMVAVLITSHQQYP